MLKFLIYLIIINVFTFIIFGVDKLKAKHNAYRISEKTLLTFCIFGGVLGGLFGMIVFRHKTKKPKFIYSLPIILIAYLFVILLVFFK